MKNQFKLALLVFNVYLVSINCAYTQENSTLQYVDKKDLKLLKQNGWELFYTSESFKLDQFDVFNSGFVTAHTISENEVKITLYNKSNIIVDDKTLKHSKSWLLHYPRFIPSDGKTVIAPFYKNQYVIDGDKGKINKKSSKFLRNQSKYYKREFNSQDFKIQFFNSLNSSENTVTFTTLYKKNEEIDTLNYVIKSQNILSYYDYTDEIEIVPFKNRIYILDNSNDLIQIYNQDGKITSSLPLPYSAKLNIGLLAFRLEIDQAFGKVYLFSIKEKNRFWMLTQKDDHSFKLKEKLIENTNFYQINVHNNHLYTIFYLKDREQYSIYRRKIND